MAIPMQTSSHGPWEGSTLTLESLQETLKPFLRKLPPDPFSLTCFPPDWDAAVRILGAADPLKSKFMMAHWWSGPVVRSENAMIVCIEPGPVRKQVKFPRSKKRRIRAKWAARPCNWSA